LPDIGVRQGTLSNTPQIARLSKNVYLLFVAIALSNMSIGIFQVAFNLYALSLGIRADLLGAILAAGPLAQFVGAIPVSMFGERLGHKRAFLGVYTLAGLAHLAQASLVVPALICVAIFVNALAISGNFVVRLPFLAAHTSASERKLAFSMSSILQAASTALGALLGGYVPSLLQAITPDLTLAYRYTLYGAALLTLSAAVPIVMISEVERPRPTGSFSLRPYFQGVGRVTRRLALVEFCLGLMFGLTVPFMNVFFVHYLGTSREFYGTVSALMIIPIILATACGPALAARLGTIRMVSGARLLIPCATLAIALSRLPGVSAVAMWAENALFQMSEAQSFAFAMDVSDGKEKSITSAWMNTVYWLGQGLTIPLVGFFFACSSYTVPFYLASIAAASAAVLTYVFFSSYDLSPASERKRSTLAVR
jgi:MFS family permease